MPNCEECGEPVDERVEAYVTDEETGETIGHAECIASRTTEPKDWREDPEYWRD